MVYYYSIKNNYEVLKGIAKIGFACIYEIIFLGRVQNIAENQLQRQVNEIFRDAHK